jgi:hypothetical protein
VDSVLYLLAWNLAVTVLTVLIELTLLTLVLRRICANCCKKKSARRKQKQLEMTGFELEDYDGVRTNVSPINTEEARKRPRHISVEFDNDEDLNDRAD